MSAGPDAFEPAPAKINLFLHVLGRRADGYHELDSLVVFAEAGDAVRVAGPPSGARLTIAGPFAGALAEMPATDNLVLRAADGLAALYRAARGESPPPVALTLEKNLPVAAGLGGGSADAAAAIHLLTKAWDFAPSDDALARLAAELGADVPVCLVSHPARMGGIGERLTHVRLPPLDLVLVNPRAPLSTREVFRALDPAAVSGPAPALPPGPLDSEALIAFLGRTRNDLAVPAERLMPEIGAMLKALDRLPGCRLARLSGSGPTAFGLFATPASADAAAQSLRAANPGWWIRRTTA